MMAVAVIVAIICDDYLSFWVTLVLAGGFVVPGQTLIKDKFVTSRGIAPPVSENKVEYPPQEHSSENHRT
jgi:hypothetical protein